MIIPDTYTLTDAGWPRPRRPIDGLPVPWVAPMENLGEVNEGRRLASVGGAICQVCGNGFNHGEEAYGFTDLELHGRTVPRDEFPLEAGEFFDRLMQPDEPILLLDGGVLHELCARMTAALCPHVRDSGSLDRKSVV